MKPILLALMLLGAISTLQAQPPPPLLPSQPDQAPIDGGLGLLAAAGSMYAWKTLRGRSKK